jgi:hypothetical protein
MSDRIALTELLNEININQNVKICFHSC